MNGETDDAEAAAARLEAALERLAALADAPRPAPAVAASAPETNEHVAVEEIATRIEGLIDRLRSALGRRAT